MKSIAYTLLTILLTLGTALHAVDGDDIIKIDVLSETAVLTPGNSTRLAVQLTIAKPWHINSNPPSGEFQIPTIVSLSDSSGIEFGEIIYPAGEMRTFAFSEEAISVYEKTVYAFASVTLPKDFTDSSVTLKGSLQYQACDDEVCLPPKTISFKKEMKVGKAGKVNAKQHEDVFRKSKKR